MCAGRWWGATSGALVAACAGRIEKLPDSALPREPPMLIVIVPCAPVCTQDSSLVDQQSSAFQAIYTPDYSWTHQQLWTILQGNSYETSSAVQMTAEAPHVSQMLCNVSKTPAMWATPLDGRLPEPIRLMGREGTLPHSMELTESDMDAAVSSGGAAGCGVAGGCRGCGCGCAARVYPSTMGCWSSCRALGRALASRTIIEPTKLAQAGDSAAEKGRIWPAVIAVFISVLSRPSKGRWPACHRAIS